MTLTLCLATGQVARAVDCDGNAADDAAEILAGTAVDCNGNGSPDSCDLFPIGWGVTTVTTASAQPTGLVADDLDADGDVDLAMTHQSTDRVTILLNAGSGTFVAGDSIGVGDGPVGIMSAHLGGGRDTALLVTNTGDGTVTVLLNDGAGHFSPGAGSPVTVGTFPLAPALFSSPLTLDTTIVVANRGSNSLAVLRYTEATGLLSVTGFVPTGSTPQALAVANVDADLEADVLVASRGDDHVLLHRGASGFPGAAVTVATVTDPIAIAAADVTGDGITDAAVAGFSSGIVTLLRGAGNGSFAPLGTIAVPQATSVQLADLDGDGLRDLVATSAAAPALLVARNDGSGGFGRTLRVPTEAGPVAVAVDDLSGDGAPDLAVANVTAGSASIVLQQASAAQDCNATGVPDVCELTSTDCNANAIPDACDLQSGFRFATPTVLTLADEPRGVAAGDLDGDGDADVALAAGVDGVPLLRADGAGALEAWTTLPVTGTPDAVLVADLEADGDADVVAATEEPLLVVSRNEGEGRFAAPITATVAPGEIRGFEAVDVDGDGDRDVVLGANLGTAGSVMVVRNDGATFTPTPAITLEGGPLGLGVGDLEPDGDLDIVVSVLASAGSRVQVLRNTGGTFSAEPGIAEDGPLASLRGAMTTIDVDGDGRGGWATQEAMASGEGRVAVLRTASGVPTRVTALPFPGERSSALALLRLRQSVTAGDLDGDGRRDLAVADYLGRRVRMWHHAGGDAFDRAVSVATLSVRPTSLAVGDIDRDGAADVIATAEGRRLLVIRSTSPAASRDCQRSGRPDECELTDDDCNGNRVPDTCEPAETDQDGDGVSDCVERGAACANCRDDDGDGALDLADATCPSTALQLKKSRLARGRRRTGGRLSLVAEVPAALTATPAPILTVALDGAALHCGPVTLVGRGSRWRLARPQGVLRALRLAVRRKAARTIVRLALQGQTIAPGARIATLSLQGSAGAFHAAGPVLGSQ